MFGLGIWELVVILVIVVLFFGVGKLPELGSGLGEGIQNFRKGLKSSGKSLEDDSKSGSAGGDASDS